MMKTVRLLAGAAWLLLGVSWIMSIYAYPRLPAEIIPWFSLWVVNNTKVGKSPAFFFPPALQTVLFLAVIFLARAVFWRGAGLAPDEPSARREFLGRLLALRKEVVYLALIFFQLIFIHLQTSLILVSHEAGAGVNRFYVGMILAVLVALIPYYMTRRRMLERENRDR
ncbi:MAG: hypothetical protein AB1715_01345 [Acidobacteriota bacterium]